MTEQGVRGGFTPGPWKAVLHFGAWSVRQDPKDWDGMGYQFIAALPASKKGSHYGEMFRANAQLIAVAPEMFGLVATIAGFTPPGRDPEYDARTLRGIIAKANKLHTKATS